MNQQEELERARLHPDVLKNLAKNKKLKVSEAYSEDNPPPYPVTSVNGQTGAVVVSVPVQSVNGQTGAVVLDAAAVGAAEPNESSGGTASGYCKMPDGTLIQWGHYTVSQEGSLTQIASSGVYYGLDYLTFPIAFYNDNYTVTGSTRYSTGHPVPIGFFSRSKSSVAISIYDFYARPMNGGNMIVRWQAIGRWK